ncbi:MAG TPA: CopG family antitoxin [bacterium]|nr:CopG family antitoxin [bacterium]
MKKRTKEKNERERYLNTDFGDLLAGLKPLNLDLEFPSPTQSISLRLPRDVLNEIRIVADERDVPYQSLIKMWVVERLRAGKKAA